jgi:phage FluMu protein Com
MDKPDVLQIKVPDGYEIRCPHLDEKKGAPCNKMFCRGRASIEPQEFKCPRCGKISVFQRLV